MDSSYTILAVTTGVVAVASAYYYLSQPIQPSSHSTLREFPGPPGLPILGNLHQLGTNPSKTFTKWTETYGPIYKIQMGRVPAIIVNSRETAHDLMTAKGGNVSGRMFSQVAQLAFDGRMMGLQSSDSKMWTAQKKLIFAGTSSKQALKRSWNVVDRESREMLLDFLERGQGGNVDLDPVFIFKRFSFNTILNVALGQRTTSLKDPLLHAVDTFMEGFADAMDPAKSIGDFIPLLKWIPTKATAAALHLKKHGRKTFLPMVEDMKHRVAAGEDVDCLLADALKTGSEYLQNSEDLCWMTGGLLSAGYETTATTMEYISLYLAANLEVQKRLQDEIDSVVGPDRVPDLEDVSIAKMPYLHATIKETMRLSPPLLLGFPHLVTSPETYLSHSIPAGTLIIANIPHIASELPPHASPLSSFDPSRFVERTAPIASDSANATTHDVFAFGFGRRMCPGRHLAERELVVGMARFFWGFEVGKPGSGEVRIEGKVGLVNSPVGGVVRVRPRGERVRRVLGVMGCCLDGVCLHCL
ncbi:hypothetical protein HDV00_005495 [Rhizophlyctis rosea]|nr:hypothetical protein HDV00_005495 [Rhizophlyctis rosea]